MPIYEYACTHCQHTLDALQKVSDEPLRDCPECGASALRRLLSAPRFRLKGQGWYETDFKTGNKRNLSGDAGSSTTSATPAKTESSGDSKKAAES